MRSLILLPMVFALAGCSAPEERQLVAEAAEARAPAPLPVNDSTDTSGLTPELLYHVLLAEIAGQRGALDVSVENYLRAAQLSRNPQVAERAARIAVYARDHDAALAAARLWVQLAPDDLEARQVAAALLVRAGQPDEALVHLERLVQAGRENERTSYGLITSLLSQEQDKQAALEVMGRLIEKHRDDGDALAAYAHLALLLGELEHALQAAERAVTVAPRLTAAHILRANILTRLERTPQALKGLAGAVEAQPDNVDLRLYYARLLLDERRLQEAQGHFQAVLERAPENSDALFASGLLALQLEELEQAEGYFKRLIQSGQRVSEAAYFLGQLEETRKAYDAALRWYAVVRGGQYNLDAQIRSAVVQSFKGDLAGARQRLNAIPADDPATRLRLFLAEGEILRQAKRYEEAYEVFTRGLAVIPGNPDLLYARALTAEAMDRLDVLEADLAAILEHEPDNAQALNALGYTLADRTDRYQEALKYIRRALELEPDDPAILDSMGWVNYRLGNHQEALKYLRLAFERLKDPEIAAHLGEVLWVAGEREAARDVWNEALQKSPKDEVLLNVIERFTE